jgi:hypothetical protein
MPISLTSDDHTPLCRGHCWHISDEDELARCVARVLVGHSRHAERIISGLPAKDPRIDAEAVKNAKVVISLADDEDPWHRDGLVFQIISWIAARKRAGDGTITRTPHLIRAHKGFDGVQIEVDFTSASVSSVILFEDKATINPRETIRDDVWPELKKIEQGDRRNEVIQEVSSLLLQASGRVDYDAAIESLFWKDARGYRVSITVGNTHATPAARKRLFKDYDTIVGGADDCHRRGAETFFIEDLRPWMAQFCARVVSILDSEFAHNV